MFFDIKNGLFLFFCMDIVMILIKVMLNVDIHEEEKEYPPSMQSLLC